ncbi:hypothetical protein [Robertmurraya sp.]|uniref:hypothetical protein n=1 Tax=Robertmurraya sp. TaxID=2837525 RepID=UPI00370424EC
MSSKTYGVKVSEEMYDRLKAAQEASGLTGSEWMEGLLAVAQMQEMKGDATFSKDVSEIETHTQRIVNIVANMIQRAAFEREGILHKVEEMRESKDQIIARLQVDLSALEVRTQDAEKLARESSQEKVDVEKQIEQLQQSAATTTALVKQYEEKIQTLTGIVTKYQSQADENEALQQRIRELEQDVHSLKQTAQTQQSEMDRLIIDHQRELERTKEQHETAIQHLQAELDRLAKDHQQELDRIKEQHETEKKQLELSAKEQVLQARSAYQEKLEQVNEAHNAQLKDLYSEMDRLRAKLTHKPDTN